MSRLLVTGMGPLLEEGTRNFGAQCLRTWFFVKPLLDDGHRLRLITLPIHDPEDPKRHRAALVRRSVEGFEYQAFTNTDPEFVYRTLREIAVSYDPDGVIGVNSYPAWELSRLPAIVPLWADLNGYEMAEKQGQAARTGSDEPLHVGWERETLIARRADKFSTVSRPQLHALLGELAMLGRMNRLTFRYGFAHHIPEAYHPAFLDPPQRAEPILRGVVVPEDAFVLLWSGGYNYWTDPEFLFDFIEAAMLACPNLHYVSTGGAIAGYNTQTYETFQRLVEGSVLRERYHLLGWTPAADVPAVYREADLGLNIDEMNYETFFGARNRLNNMMVMGLPVLTTRGSEISRMIEKEGGGIVCPPGDVDRLVEAVRRMALHPAERERLGARAREFTLEAFESGALTQAVRDWAEEPRLAPDNAEKLRNNPNLRHFAEESNNRIEEIARILADHDPDELMQAYADLQIIRARPLFRAGKAVKDALVAVKDSIVAVKDLVKLKADDAEKD